MLQKLRWNFASGNLGTKDYAYSALQPGNIIWEAFSPWGNNYWRTSQLCFCYLFAIYLVILGGAVCTFLALLRKKEVPLIKRIADLALLGNIIFLMIWEANNRQLYNQAPVILLGGFLNIMMILGCLRRRGRKPLRAIEGVVSAAADSAGQKAAEPSVAAGRQKRGAAFRR
ncbi:MAG: hypothetical protein NC432_05135 [Roseburia sp.]|nr:hypothetical protein [Roseburia sp.]MCM1097891.1 hypothetical protein [Ruminococcus flavefaciens]